MIEFAFMLVLATVSPQAQEVPVPPACRGSFETIDWQACADASGQGTPGYALAMINLGTGAYLQGDYTSALRYYDKAETPGQSIASDVIFHAFRGDTYRHAGRMEAARQDAERAWMFLENRPPVGTEARDLIPINDEIRFIVLNAILPILREGDAGIYGQARAMYVGIPVPDADSLSNRAATLEQLGEFDAALVDSKRAVDLNPGDARLLNNHCFILVRAGQAEQGLPYCEQAVALVPDVAPVRHSYATALAAMGRCTDADRQLAEARRLDPSSALYRERLSCTPKP